MSKIYEALKRHQTSTDVAAISPPNWPSRLRGPIMNALESAYELVQRQAASTEKGLVLHFVAPSRGEGATTLSNAFAQLAASAGDLRVLLVDADRGHLATAANFGCDTDRGIYDEMLLRNRIDGSLVTKEGNDQLRVGVLCGHRSPALVRKSLLPLYEYCRSNFDLTILDCPAVFAEGYFELLPQATDGILMVVQAEHSRPAVISHAHARLDETGAKVLGAILNRRHRYIPSFIYRLL
jgi:Mrp family chromosome partitioning ATPase